MDPTQTLWLPPALEGIPIGHQLLQAFLVLEGGWQLLLGAGMGKEQVSGLGGWELGTGKLGTAGRVTSLSLLRGCRTSFSKFISNSARMRASWF